MTDLAAQVAELREQVSSLRILVGLQLLLSAGALGGLLALLARVRRGGDAAEAVTMLQEQRPDVADAGAYARAERSRRAAWEERRARRQREEICGTGSTRPPSS